MGRGSYEDKYSYFAASCRSPWLPPGHLVARITSLQQLKSYKSLERHMLRRIISKINLPTLGSPSSYFISRQHQVPQKLFKATLSSMQKQSPKKEEVMNFYKSQNDIELLQSTLELPLKQFSVRLHQLVVGKQRSGIFWNAVERDFMERLKPTTDPVVIRSHAKVIYALSKSKQATGNYETSVSLVLPFASRQSFTTLVTALSRIAPWSTEFAHVVEKLYYKRKQEFNPREMVSINYSLSHNGRPCDPHLSKRLASLNCVETVTMLRCYDMSDAVTPALLTSVFKKLRSIRREFNIIDLSNIIRLYLKHGYQSQEFDQLAEDGYRELKKNIDDVCMEKMWEFMPQSINRGGVRVGLTEMMCETILILRKSRNMSEVIWRRISDTFASIENVEIRLRLQKIY